jgi:solute carrier family 25 carnitine/acylcarnitine transporter 20/29
MLVNFFSFAFPLLGGSGLGCLVSFMDFLAGYAGALSVVLVTHPMETVKVELQSAQLQRPGHFPYRSSIDCAVKILLGQAPGRENRKGFRAFYQGVAAPLAGVGLSNAALFGVYGSLTSYFARRKYPDDDEVGLAGHLQNASALTVPENMLCASAAAVASSFAMTPFEIVKLRLMSQQFFSHREYVGAWDCAKKLYDQGGLQKLYRGWTATIIRDVPGAIAYFGCYGLTRQILPQDSATVTTASILFAGGVAGVAQWMLIYPLDVVKTNIQIEKDECRTRDWVQSWRQIYKKGGIAAFYVGIAPALAKAFFANSCCFLGVEVFLTASRYIRPQETDD